MSQQTPSTDLIDRLRDTVADVRIPAEHAFGIAPQLAETIAQVGFQATTGTIAFAGRYATGDFAVQYNDQNGGFSSVWPQWAFDLAKDALLGGTKVWVASNGDPFGSNLVFVMIFG